MQNSENGENIFLNIFEDSFSLFMGKWSIIVGKGDSIVGEKKQKTL